MSIPESNQRHDAYVFPNDCGTQSLAKFLEDAHHNTVATIANLRLQYEALGQIDRVYREMIENLNQHPELVAGFLLIRAHSAFRAAVRLSLSGQIPEAYMVLRGCLESALYGLYVAGNTNRQETWLRRHEDDASERRVRDEFKIGKVLEHVKAIDAKTYGIAKSLCDRTIDNGGHPNQRAVSTQIKTSISGPRADFTAEYFVCGDLPHKLSLKSAAQIGICCLDIFSSVFRDRYRILGIDQRLDQIRQSF